MQGKHYLCTQFYSKTKCKQSNLLPSTSIEYIFLPLGLDTSFQLQSILTLIVQIIVSAVYGAYSKQQQEP